MDEVLLDTNIVSYFIKVDTRAKLYARHIEKKILYISIITLGELYRWPIRRNWGKARHDDFERQLKLYTVLNLDDDTCRIFAKIGAQRGKPISYHDSWIAATALQYNL